MSTYQTKNYTAHGGAETIIGGKLTFLPDATVEGLTALLGIAESAYVLPAAVEATLGGVKAAAKTASDTVPCVIGDDHKLYVPTYPVVPEQPVAAAQADSTAATIAALKDDFNSLLGKLRTAGLLATEAVGE